jgi:hypothetical protein
LRFGDSVGKPSKYRFRQEIRGGLANHFIPVHAPQLFGAGIEKGNSVAPVYGEYGLWRLFKNQ